MLWFILFRSTVSVVMKSLKLKIAVLKAFDGKLPLACLTVLVVSLLVPPTCCVQGPAKATMPRARIDLLIIIDTSKSMQGAGGGPNIFPSVKEASKQLVDWCEPGDNVVLSSFDYTLLLVTLYSLLLCFFWLFRKGLYVTDRWMQFGLADLDNGVHGVWPYLWRFGLGIFTVAVAILAVSEHRMATVIESVAAATVVLVAAFGAPPRVQDIDEYDPLPHPKPFPTPSPKPEPVPPSKDVIPLSMFWYFHRDPVGISANPRRYEISLEASNLRYQEFLKQDHTIRSIHDYARFVRNGTATEIDESARQTQQISDRDNLGAIAEINNVLTFAQRFPYVRDDVDKGVSEYPKFPFETLVEDRGDCEDHAILAAACLIKLGHEVRLVSVDYGKRAGHMALAVAGSDDLPGAHYIEDPASGRKFYYCEATTDAGSQNPNAIAFRMGDIPDSERKAKMELIRLS